MLRKYTPIMMGVTFILGLVAGIVITNFQRDHADIPYQVKNAQEALADCDGHTHAFTPGGRAMVSQSGNLQVNEILDPLAANDKSNAFGTVDQKSIVVDYDLGEATTISRVYLETTWLRGVAVTPEQVNVGGVGELVFDRAELFGKSSDPIIRATVCLSSVE